MAKKSKIMKIEKEQKLSYWQAQRKAFLASFSNIAKKGFFKSMLFDLLTLLTIIIIMNTGIVLVQRMSFEAMPELMKVYDLKQSGDLEAFNSQIAEFMPVITRVVGLSLLVAVLAFLLISFFISWWYGKAWCFGLGKKFSARYLRKYFLLNIIWFLGWLVLLFLTINIFVTKAAAIVIILEGIFFFYADPVLRAVFNEGKSIRENFSLFFRTAAKFYWFIFFILVSIILGIILLLISSIFMKTNVLFLISVIIFTILFIGWMRNYIIQLVKSIT